MDNKLLSEKESPELISGFTPGDRFYKNIAKRKNGF